MDEQAPTAKECREVLDLVRRRHWQKLAASGGAAKLAPLASRYLLNREEWASASEETKGKCLEELSRETILTDLATSDGDASPEGQAHLILKTYYLDKTTHEEVLRRLGTNNEPRYWNEFRPHAFERLSMAWRKRLQAGLSEPPAFSADAEQDARVAGSGGQTAERRGPEGPDLIDVPTPPAGEQPVTASRRPSSTTLGTNETLVVTYTFENRSDRTASFIWPKPDVPAAFRMSYEPSVNRVTVVPGEVVRLDIELLALKEGSFVFQEQAIAFEEPWAEQLTCHLASFSIDVFFSGSADSVGRSKEREQMAQLGSLARGGRGQLVLVSGEAGVGKSRLVEDFVQELRRLGMTTLSVRCSQFHKEMPLLPFQEVCTKLLSVIGQPSSTLDRWQQDEVPSIHNEELHSLSQALAPFVAPGGPGTSQAEGLKRRIDPSVERDSFFFTFLSLLERSSAQRPVVLWIDDLQWSDSGSLDLLQFTAAHLEDLPVLVIGTFRSEDLQWSVDNDHSFQRMIHSLAAMDLCHEFVLSPLTTSETIEVVDSVFNGSQFSTQFYELIHREAEGNPFFIISVLRSLVETEVISKSGDVWRLEGDVSKIGIPKGIERVIQTRLQHLNEDERLELQTASVLGREFLFNVLREVSDRSESEVIRLLESSIHHDLVRSMGTIEEKFGFSHGKIQQVIYEEIPAPRRRRMHAKVASVLEALYPDDRDAMAPVLGLHHYRAGNAKASLEYLISAIHLNAAAFNLSEAWNEVDLAEQLLKQLPESELATLRFRLRKEQGHLYKSQGDFIEAEKAYRWCLNQARANGDFNEEAWALDNLGDTLNLRDEYAPAEECYLQAKVLADRLEDEELRTEIAADLGEIYYRISVQQHSQGEKVISIKTLDKAEDYVQEVIGRTSQSNDWASLRRAYDRLGIIWAARGDFHRAIDSYEKSLAIAEDHDLNRGALNSLGEAYRILGRMREALPCYERFLQFARDTGDKRAEILALNNLGVVRYETGNDKQALDYLDQSIALNRKVGFKSCEAESRFVKGILLYQAGRSEEAINLCRQGLELVGGISDSDSTEDVLKKVARERYANAEYRQVVFFLRKFREVAPTRADEEVDAMLDECTAFSESHPIDA